MSNMFKDIDMTEKAYANNVGGLEQLVQQGLQKDKNKGPLALADNLVEILALNELKGKIDASKRDITLKAAQARGGQQPTIKQKLEKSLVDQTINDKVNGVAGVLTNNLRKRNKYMNKFADRGVKAPSNVNFQAPMQPLRMANFNKGIAGNKKNMNLASGGIVGYSAGDTIKSVLSEALDTVKARYKKLYGGTIEKISDSEIVQKYIAPAIEEIGYQKDVFLEDAPEIANKALEKISEVVTAGATAGKETLEGAAFDALAGGRDLVDRGVDFLTTGEYSSPDPSVLGGGNTNTNAAVSQELGGLRSDLKGTGQEIKDLEGAISNADKRIAQNDAISNEMFGKEKEARSYLEGFDPNSFGPDGNYKRDPSRMLIPGTEQDLVDRNTAIQKYADDRYYESVDASRKFKDDKKQFEGELAGAQEASSDITSEIMFLQDMARKARMGDPEAIAFMNAQGKRNIQKGLAGIYGNKNVDPAMMKMVEAQQFPSTAPVDSEAVKKAGENRAGIFSKGYMPQVSNYPTYSPANIGLAALDSAGQGLKEGAMNVGSKILNYANTAKDSAKEMFLDAGDVGVPLLEEGLEYIFDDKEDPKTEVAENKDGSDIDFDKGMKVTDDNTTTMAAPLSRPNLEEFNPNNVGSGSGSGSGSSSSSSASASSGGIGNVGSMNDVVNLISELENKYRGEKGGYAKIIYALTNMDTRGGGGAYGRAASQFDQITAARASETAKMAINTMLKVQENNIRARSNELQAQLRNDSRLSRNVYNLRQLLLKNQEAKQGFSFNFGTEVNDLTAELTTLTAKQQNNKLENKEEEERLLALPNIIESIRLSNPDYAELVAEGQAITAQIKSLEGSLGGSGV